MSFFFPSSEVFVVPYQDLLNFSDIHCVVVALRIALVDGFLIDDAAWHDISSIDFFTDEHQLGLLKIDRIVGIDRCEASLSNLILVTSGQTLNNINMFF